MRHVGHALLLPCLLLATLSVSCSCRVVPPTASTALDGDNDNIIDRGFVRVNNETALRVCADDVVRVVKTPRGRDVVEVALRKTSLVVNTCPSDSAPPTLCSVIRMGESLLRVTTGALVVVADVATGRLTFVDRTTGQEIASEAEGGGAEFVPAVDPGDDSKYRSYKITQRWRRKRGGGANVSNDEDESIYGGGGFQNGFLDYADAAVQLKQFNTEAVVPLFTSSRGYGVLWDNYAVTHLNEPIPEEDEIHLRAVSSSSTSAPQLRTSSTPSSHPGTILLRAFREVRKYASSSSSSSSSSSRS